MPVGVLLLIVPIASAAAAVWAWGYQYRMLDLVQRDARSRVSRGSLGVVLGDASPEPQLSSVAESVPESASEPEPEADLEPVAGLEPEAVPEALADPAIPGWPVGEGASRLATEERDRTSRSVLGWSQFRILSVVALDGTAIVACRAADGETASAPRGRQRQRRPGRGGARSRTASPWPLMLAADQTLVLLIGDGNAAERAQELLDRWRRAATVLWLRPTAVTGGIEFFDGRRSALRAILLAA